MTAPTPPTPNISDDEWREFQRIPEQGYSHRHWVDHKIATALAAVAADRDDARRELAEQKRINASNLRVMTEQLEQARQTIADAPHDDGCDCSYVKSDNEWVEVVPCTCWKAGL